MDSTTGFDAKRPTTLTTRARAAYGLPGVACSTGITMTIQAGLDVRPHQRSFGRRDQRPR